METSIRHVVITGGGSGLGFGLVTRYLKRGASVSILDLHINDERKEALASIVEGGASHYTFIETDVTKSDEVKRSINFAVQKYGIPDLAINSAGVLINKTIEDTSPSEFKRVVDINLNGSFNFASAILPFMKPGARIALIASVAGLTSNYAYSAYGASKFGVVGLATTLRYEYQNKGIHVSCVCPPEVKTPMVAQEHAEGNKVSLELKKFAGSMQADDACDQILAGLDAGKWMIVPSVYAKVIVAVARIFPRTFSAFMHRLIRVAMKKTSVVQAS